MMPTQKVVVTPTGYSGTKSDGPNIMKFGEDPEVATPARDSAS